MWSGSEYVVLCLAGAAGGAVNSIAGGGTLLTFPALCAILAGMGSFGTGAEYAVVANGTSTVALFPGSFAAMWGYRRELSETRRWAKVLIGPSLVGGLVGALLATRLPAKTFQQLVPWLILGAASLFALQPQIGRWIGIGSERAEPSRKVILGVVLFQFFVGIYGGYFGAGIGILMLSALALMGIGDIHRMNSVKTLLAATINTVAAGVFIVQNKVYWPFALSMGVAAIIGGYAGARIARRMNRAVVRGIVVAIGFGLAAYYFLRGA